MNSKALVVLFEVFREKSVWSIPAIQTDEHMIAVPASGGFTLLLGQKQEAYKTLTKQQQRFWKRILIVDDDADLTMTFRAVIEHSNNDVDVNKRRDTRSNEKHSYRRSARGGFQGYN